MEMTTAKFAGKSVFANPNTGNVKLSSRGKALHIGDMLGSLPKGEARKFRKALRGAGLPNLAGSARKVA